MSDAIRWFMRFAVVVAFAVFVAVAFFLIDVNLGVPVALPLTNMALSAALVWFTWELVREGRLSREARFAPGLAVYIRPSESVAGVIELVIANYGTGPAHQIKLAIERDLTVRNGGRLTDLPVMRHGLMYLPPGERFSAAIGSDTFFQDNAPAEDEELVTVSVRATCTGSTGRRYDFDSWLDLLPRLSSQPAGARIADQLGNIEKALRHKKA